MFKFWGDGSQEMKNLVDSIAVRSTENFNWTFIFILSVVFYVYWTEIHNKNYKAVFAGLALYGVHWLYEIGNAIIGHFAGYPLIHHVHSADRCLLGAFHDVFPCGHNLF